MTGLEAGMARTDLFRGLRGGFTLHGALVEGTGGFDGLVGGGLGVVLLDEEKSRRGGSRWSPRLAFGLDAGYLFRDHASESRAYLTGLGWGPFTFGGGVSMLLVEPSSRPLQIGLALGPEVDAHMPFGDGGPVLQLFLRADAALLRRDLVSDSVKLGVRLLIDVF